MISKKLLIGSLFVAAPVLNHGTAEVQADPILGTELPTAIAERVEQAGRPGSTVFYVGNSSDIQVTIQ